MCKNVCSVIVFGFLILSQNYGQAEPVEKGLNAITMDAIKAQLGFLASDWTEGRMAGEKGAYLAADYIASMLQLYGVKPGGDDIYTTAPANNIRGNEKSYFQNFVLLKTSAGNEQVFKVKSTESKTVKTTDFTYNVDFITRYSGLNNEIEAPVVFTGYGIISNKLKHNDFSKLNVKGKFILRIAGFPRYIMESLNTAELASSARETESTLKAMGALGIIEFNPTTTVVGNPPKRDFENLSPSEGNPRPGDPNVSFSIPGKNSPDNLIKIRVSVKVANEIIKGTGINIDDYITKADANEPFDIPSMTDKSIYFKTTVQTTSVAVRNIIGVIEGNNPEQVIVLGAHYDHMGISNGYIWNGADDNGSGTIGVMTLAKAIMETGRKPDKTIIVALWTAEEEGLLGSRYWVQNPTVPIENIKLNVNFDMISRYISEDQPNKVTMTYTSSCPVFKDITSANLNRFGIDLVVDYQPSANPPGGTDHRSFVAVDVPIMRFKPGHREEYHTPMDEIDTTDWDIMEKIIKITFANVWELSNSTW